MAVERVFFKLRDGSKFSGYKGTYLFQNGIHSAVLDSGKIEKRARVMSTFYGAERVDASQIHESAGSRPAEPVRGDRGPNGSESAPVPSADGVGAAPTAEPPAANVPAGDGRENAGDDGKAEFEDRLRQAVLSLDRENDEHWTADGRPRVDAVEKAYGSAGVTRADVERVAPGYTRTSE